MVTFEEFEKLAAEANLIPVCQRVIADLETPVSVLSRFADDDNVFLLESVEAGEKFGRYSFIGVNPRGVFSVEQGKPFYRDSAGKKELSSPESAFMVLRDLLKDVRPALIPELPPLFGGAVGYIGYEMVREFEQLPEPKRPSAGADCEFMITDEMIIFDNINHTMMLSVCVRPAEYSNLRAAYDDAIRRIGELKLRLKQTPQLTNLTPQTLPPLKSNMSRQDYMNMVEKGKHYIYEGDIIQVVPSLKFSTEVNLPPLQIYRALRLINPSPYTFFLKIGKRVLVGSSPETLVKLEGKSAVVRPIAGTRKRGKNAEQDRALAEELLHDEKERAEHVMLVDLGRNDLGRVAVPGSVQVKDFMTVERYSHVMHLVTSVEAQLAEGQDAFDLVRSTFPAGTLSGAPKIRAMEIIHELEPEPRGVYGGAVGYFSYTHNMDLAITIRTLLMEGKKISLQAGAGVVFDSIPASEYEECCNKAAALLKSLELAAAGLEL